MQRWSKGGIFLLVWFFVSGIVLTRPANPVQATQPLLPQSLRVTDQAQVPSILDQSGNLSATSLISGTWQSGFNDLSFANGTITSAITDTAGNWYVGGYFNQIDGVAVNNIARWDGSTWSALSTAAADWANWNYRVSTMAFWGDDLYVGGANLSIGGLDYVDLAYWDGSTWHQAGSGFDQYGTVSKIAVFNNELFFAGSFEQFNGVAVRSFARWDGTTINQLSTDIHKIEFMQASSANLYIAGKRWVNESLVDTVQVWDGTNFQTIASAEISPYSLKIIDNQLYGIRKLSANSSALVRWDGSAWSVVIDTIPFVINNFAFDADQFYAEAQNGTSFALYRYDNQQWQPLTTCNCNAEHTLYLVNNQLFMTSEQHKPLLNYSNNQWQEFVVKSAYPYTAKIVTYQDDVYIASIQKVLINDVYKEVNYVRSWEDNTWKVVYQISNTHTLIDMKATDIGVYLLIQNDSTEYYDIYYYKQGQNGVSILPDIEIGLSEILKLFVLNGNTLYAIIINSIYKWNGTQWVFETTLPYQNPYRHWIDPFIYNQQLHLLTEAGRSLDNRPLLRIFRRDGNQWINQNIVLEGYLSDSSANANGLYIAGQFYHNDQVYHLVKWDGSQLQFIETQTVLITSVAAEGNNVYVGGLFNQLPGCVCYNLGYWNGSAWQSVDGGTNGLIESLSLSGRRLYMHGWFSQTGDIAAVGFGGWVRNYPYKNHLPFVNK